MALMNTGGKKTGNQKYVGEMREWARVAGELAGEDLKQKIYDNTLVDLLGNLRGKRILDYGAGPAVIARRIQELGAHVRVFDISQEMLKISEEKLGPKTAYHTRTEIPKSEFDIVLCNLVLCIVPEEEVAVIARNIERALKDSGVAYVGFCNPRIFDIPESIMDLRMQTGNAYDDNHTYKKVKKEGGYQILELHRPIEWYLGVFRTSGLEFRDIHFTPEYDANGRRISDFVIFRLGKKSDEKSDEGVERV